MSKVKVRYRSPVRDGYRVVYRNLREDERGRLYVIINRQRCIVEPIAVNGGTKIIHYRGMYFDYSK